MVSGKGDFLYEDDLDAVTDACMFDNDKDME